MNGLATVLSRAQIGLDAPQVAVEVHLHGGLPRTNIVGLPETVVKESKDRVRGTLENLNYRYPDGRIVVNLAPADLPKEGSRFDLPIAIGILAASRQVPATLLPEIEFLGELALTGELRRVNAVLPAVVAAERSHRAIVIPASNGLEASYSRNPAILPAATLLQVCQHLCEHAALRPLSGTKLPGASAPMLSLADIRGQHAGKRALRIAATGGHNLLMVGPPGTGKTMLAARFASLLPPLDESDALEVAAIYSVARGVHAQLHWGRRPFRTPHHTASPVAMVGGGSPPKPGEISLAHSGVLFLDEFPEFGRNVLEVLREPLETGEIVISRAAHQIRYPARFQLIAAMNPCPCGYYGDQSGRCRCSEEQIARYRRRISGPLLDRIDLHVMVPTVPVAQLSAPVAPDAADEDEEAQRQVSRARAHMLRRNGKSNAALSPAEVDAHCRLAAPDQLLLERAMERFQLSARAYYRILKVARTIADLDLSREIATAHLAEAVGYRFLDRGSSGIDGPMC